MNNILRDEIELTDAELAGVYGADDDDQDEDQREPAEKVEERKPEEREEPCVNIFIICRRKPCSE
jgi:hypothetical protein